MTDKPYRGGKLIESIRSNLIVQIGGKDLYHMECQMKQGGDIAVRMLEYDVNAVLVHGLEKVENTQKQKRRNVHPYKYKLQFPKSAILYLDSTERTPDEESCIMVLPNGTEYDYSIPVTCDHIFSNEPELLKGVHGVMEPVIKLVREQKDDELKLLRDELKQKENEIKFLREQLEKAIIAAKT